MAGWDSVNGIGWCVWHRIPSLRFHGLGQKAGPFEKKRVAHTVFNTDLWGAILWTRSVMAGRIRSISPSPGY